MLRERRLQLRPPARRLRAVPQRRRAGLQPVLLVLRLLLSLLALMVITVVMMITGSVFHSIVIMVSYSIVIIVACSCPRISHRAARAPRMAMAGPPPPMAEVPARAEEPADTY